MFTIFVVITNEKDTRYSRLPVAEGERRIKGVFQIAGILFMRIGLVENGQIH